MTISASTQPFRMKRRRSGASVTFAKYSPQNKTQTIQLTARAASRSAAAFAWPSRTRAGAMRRARMVIGSSVTATNFSNRAVRAKEFILTIGSARDVPFKNASAGEGMLQPRASVLRAARTH
jgi:hypothetical protein